MKFLTALNLVFVFIFSAMAVWEATRAEWLWVFLDAAMAAANGFWGVVIGLHERREARP